MGRKQVKRDEDYSVALLTPPLAESDPEALETLAARIEEEGPAPECLREFHKRLGERFPSSSANTQTGPEDGTYMDGGVRASYSRRAAVVSTSARNAEYAMPVILRIAFDLGLSVYEQATGYIHRPEGLRGATLKVESWPPMPGPTRRQIHDTVDRLTPDGGPGFLCLEMDGPDYVQAAGGDGAYAVEWRDHSGSRYRHWKAGLPGKAQGRRTRIKTNGFSVSVYENERLAAGDVKAILAAFAEGKKRPAEYVWRDMTAELV